MSIAKIRATEYLITGIGFLGAVVVAGMYYLATHPF